MKKNQIIQRFEEGPIVHTKHETIGVPSPSRILITIHGKSLATTTLKYVVRFLHN